MARLHDYYTSTVVPDLVKQFGYQSVMEVPRIEKITLNSSGVLLLLPAAETSPIEFQGQGKAGHGRAIDTRRPKKRAGPKTSP